MTNKQTNVICNSCGRKLSVCNGILKEDCLSVNKSWGYFSSRDGRTHSFILCESCYNKLIDSFKVPVSESETTELL